MYARLQDDGVADFPGESAVRAIPAQRLGRLQGESGQGPRCGLQSRLLTAKQHRESPVQGASKLAGSEVPRGQARCEPTSCRLCPAQHTDAPVSRHCIWTARLTKQTTLGQREEESSPSAPGQRQNWFQIWLCSWQDLVLSFA